MFSWGDVEENRLVLFFESSSLITEMPIKQCFYVKIIVLFYIVLTFTQ